MHRGGSVTFREQLAYGCGDFASVLYWQTFMKYLPYYYTDVFGLSAAALGGMLLFSRVLDAVSDPLIGIWADRSESRWGKFRPFILFGAVPFVALGVLTFTTPDWDSGNKIIWAYVTYNGLMLLYTLVNIPYTAMLGVMSPDPAVRTRLSSVKFVFAFSAGMVISATLLPMARALGEDGRNPQQGWQLSFVIVGLIALFFFLLTFFGTRERITPVRDPEASIRRDLALLSTNKAWLVLLATTLTFILFVATRSSVFAHYFKYHVYDGDLERKIELFGIGMNFDQLVSSFNAGGQAMSVVGVLLTAAFAERLPKRRLFVTFFGLAIVATASYFVIPPERVNWLFVMDALGSASSAPLSVLLWAMYADAADDGELRSGRRTTGLIFSASTMGQKMGWALGGYLAFQLLSSVGFAPHVTPSAEVRESLVLLMSLVPAAIGIVSIAIFRFYPLDDRGVVRTARELSRRRDALP